MHGAATNPQRRRVRLRGGAGEEGLEATEELGGENYVFWGGREGYASLEHRHEARARPPRAASCTMAATTPKIGFTGQFFIEPKPKEPTKHQYDFDGATVPQLPAQHGLDKDFKLNIETNHATLAGHTIEHELEVAADARPARLHRRQPRRPAARLGHRPVPDRHLPTPSARCWWCCARAGCSRAA